MKPEPNATPAPLTMTPADETMYREQMRDGRVYRIDRPSLVVLARSVFAELDATRAKLADTQALALTAMQNEKRALDKLAEAEAQRDDAMALADASRALVVTMGNRAHAAESRVAALLVALNLARDFMAEHYACDQPVLAAIDAALSPSQDAKDGGAV